MCAAAGMRDTAFLRSDELPGRSAVGYLAADGWRTNVLHLPLRGSGDGGIYSTASDVHALWAAFFAGRLVSTRWVAEMLRPRSDIPSQSSRYGLGFWLHASQDAVMLEGYDAGVSFRTVHHPTMAVTHTVLSNTSGGAWPITRHLDELLTMRATPKHWRLRKQTARLSSEAASDPANAHRPAIDARRQDGPSWLGLHLLSDPPGCSIRVRHLCITERAQSLEPAARS